MSLWSLIETRQSPTFCGEESAQQKSPEGAATRESDDKKRGHEEGRDAEANDRVKHEEKKQKTQKDNRRKAEEEEDDVAAALEVVLEVEEKEEDVLVRKADCCDG